MDRCCTTAYSVECVGIARKLPQVCDLEKAPCNKPSLAGGCNKAECEDQVCDSKPECCNTDAQLGEWSLACVDVAEQLCDRVNSCFEGVKKPGCNDPVCETYVCKTDDFCCRVQWDSSCVKKAMTNLEECSNDFPIQDNDCFHADPFDRPKCIGNDVCLESVCAIRPECCLESYSKECSDIALKACTLPVPENHCFQSSTVPGCDDEKCLEKVCEEDDKCCTVAYNGNCVGIARQNGLVCIPPNVGNICTKQSSPYGGCADYRCANSVCNFFAGCCNDGNEIGEWDRPCVSQAQDICQPEVIPRPPDAVECPVGYTCDVEIMTNCTDLAMTYIETWQFGE